MLSSEVSQETKNVMKPRSAIQHFAIAIEAAEYDARRLKRRSIDFRPEHGLSTSRESPGRDDDYSMLDFYVMQLGANGISTPVRMRGQERVPMVPEVIFG